MKDRRADAASQIERHCYQEGWRGQVNCYMDVVTDKVREATGVVPLTRRRRARAWEVRTTRQTENTQEVLLPEWTGEQCDDNVRVLWMIR